jgi:hypothetical protein
MLSGSRQELFRLISGHAPARSGLKKSSFWGLNDGPILEATHWAIFLAYSLIMTNNSESLS